MPDTSEPKSATANKRIFDCPWCGAISRVKPAVVGTHFTCPECFDDTKLTLDNTRAGSMLAPDPEAPPAEAGEKESYAPGHRTFDCPWCGAISGVDPARMGESFNCPECSKQTKLTEATLRHRPVTAAPADAPAVASRFQPIWIAGVGVVAVIAIAIAIFAGGSGEDGSSPSPIAKVDASSADSEPVAGTPSPEGPTHVPTEEAPEAPTEQPAEMPPPVEPVPAVMREPPPELVTALETARQALAAWEAAHPETLAVLAVSKACGEVKDEASRLCEERESVNRNPEQARAYNGEMRAYVHQDSRRVGAAEWVREHLNSERLKPLLLESWEELNFCLPRVQATFIGGETLGRSLDPQEHVQLRRAVEQAEAALAAAVMPGGAAPDG